MEEPRYRPFHETYRLSAYAMIIASIYPNPEKRKIRWLTAGLTFLSVAPFASFVAIAMYKFCRAGDVINVVKQSTVGGPFLGGFLKVFVMNYHEKSAKRLMDEMNADYALFNKLPAHHRRIVDEGIRTSRIYAERGYITFISFCVLSFPILTMMLNSYLVLVKSEPSKYLIHDVPIPFMEPEVTYTSPYFEIMFVYMVFCTLLFLVLFTGFEVFFELCINHACLKMKLYCAAMEDAMKATSREQMYGRVTHVIQSQCKAFSYVDTIQIVFNIYIGVTLFATMIQICTCLYHVTEGYELDPKYIVYTLGTIAYVYLPCQYSSKLKNMSSETANLLYCCGWEAIPDPWPRKALVFMILREQRPKGITAFNMFVFDMELFVSILKASYSLYTLLRS
nr:odorant receptor 28 [Papilio glaucus]